MKIYIDDSVHTRGDFIISALVFTNNDVENQIREILKAYGFVPGEDEFKSGLSYQKNPKMMEVRRCLKSIISANCKIGIVVLPIALRKKIGVETFKGLKRIINSNNFQENIEVFIDQNYFDSVGVGENQAKIVGLHKHNLNLEADSKEVMGIQLADLVAHTCSTMLLEQLKVIDKKVKVRPSSGYDIDTEIELGFELWAGIRYNLLGQIDMERFENGDGLPVKLTEPYGLYISEYCDEVLSKNAKERFGEIYLGCIH